MTDFRTPHSGEPGPQPDPMLQTGRRSLGWVWLFTIAVVAIVAVTLYGINNQEPQTAANENAAPAAQGETTGAAPSDHQDQQNGNAAAQKSGGSNQKATPANSPNSAPPQKDQSGQTNQKPQQ